MLEQKHYDVIVCSMTSRRFRSGGDQKFSKNSKKEQLWYDFFQQPSNSAVQKSCHTKSFVHF